MVQITLDHTAVEDAILARLFGRSRGPDRVKGRRTTIPARGHCARQLYSQQQTRLAVRCCSLMYGAVCQVLPRASATKYVNDGTLRGRLAGSVLRQNSG